MTHETRGRPIYTAQHNIGGCIAMAGIVMTAVAGAVLLAEYAPAAVVLLGEFAARLFEIMTRWHWLALGAVLTGVGLALFYGAGEPEREPKHGR